MGESRGAVVGGDRLEVLVLGLKSRYTGLYSHTAPRLHSIHHIA